MQFTATTFAGAWLIAPTVHQDERGFFLESYVERLLAQQGIHDRFVQDNHSMSVSSGVLRGLHFQAPPQAQSKLVRVVHGAVFDAIVDLRRGSATYGSWEGFTLSADNHLMLYVPRGFAHGFCTLAERTEVMYKADNYYAPQHEGGIVWNDPSLAVRWPVSDPTLSEKDLRLPPLVQFTSPF